MGVAKYSPAAREKIARVLREFRAGELRSSSGEVVTDPEQALAIAIEEARAEGLKVPPKPGGE